MTDKELGLITPSNTDKLRFFILNNEGEREFLQKLGLIDRYSKLSKRGLKVFSFYPFYGSGEEKQMDYPFNIFSLLFSLGPEGRLKNSHFQSLLLSKYFPLFEKDRIENLFSIFLESSIKLKIVYIYEGEYRINRENLFSFTSLTLIDRLSYILSLKLDKKPEEVKKALSLLEKVNGLKKADYSRVEEEIERLTSVRLQIELLRTFFLISENEELLTARSLTPSMERKIIFSNDFTITIEGYEDSNIYLIATPLVLSNVSQWVIDRVSIKKALDLGLSEDEIFAIISSYPTSEINCTVKERIKEWIDGYNSIKISHSTLIRVNERYYPIFSLPELKKYILYSPCLGFYVMDEEREDEWRKLLLSYGLEIGKTMGREYKNKEEKVSFTPLKAFFNYPLKRAISFNSTLYNELLKKAKSEYERRLIRTNLALIKEFRESVDGLEYTKKIEQIKEAIKDGEALVVEDINQKQYFLMPFKTEGDILYSSLGYALISRIWKLRRENSIILERDLNPLDSDSQ